MGAIDEKSKHEPRPAGIGPGERLQAARIQQGLSLEDVAKRMHLSANILEAIEDNNFEEITAPIFVKGYLRAYARIVSLDEDEMIAQYSDYYSEDDPPITSTSNMAPELSVADARIKWTTYLVIIILATLLAAWWWNKEQNDDVPITLDTQSSSSEQPAATDTDSASSKIEAVSENLIESNAAETAETAETADSQTPAATEVTGVAESESADAVVVQEPAAEEVVREPAAEEVVREPAAEEVVREPAAEEVVQEPTAEESEVEAAEVMAPETAGVVDTGPTRIAPAGTDKMQLIVNAATWADIKDSSGYQLVYDLLRADETVDLMGQAPFTVFLGNGHGVEIIFNGGEIDISRRIRDDNTARLKIGG